MACAASACSCGAAGARAVASSASASPSVAAAPARSPAAARSPASPPSLLRRLLPKPKKRPGSGIPARLGIRVLVWVRRFAQAGFLLLFLWLVFRTGFRGSFAETGERVRVGLPVEGFLSADPFVGAMTLLSTHTVYRGLVWSLVVLGLTLVFGRVFCGWICPFGTLHHLVGWIFPSRYQKGTVRIEANKTHPRRQRIKYYLLYASLGAAVAGTAIGGMLDPICVMVRSVGLAVLPAAQYVTNAGAELVARSDVAVLQRGSDAVADFLATTVWQRNQFYFHSGWLIGGLFLAVVFLNRFVPRFWCRVLCPLGAFLGVFARFALFGMEKDHDKCTDCDACLVHCQGADSPQGGVKWRQDECHMCLNCEAACPEDVIKFRFLPGRASRVGVPDTDRRAALVTAAAGVALVPVARAADALVPNYDARLIRPPGSVDETEFLERCIRCAECMKVCPNNALHPALLEGGIEGLWTPVLIPRIGYCEPSCVLCGDVCPTGAIQKITEEQKLGIDQKPISIGTAFYDLGRCLPWAMATPCIVCEEFCPTSPKAIWVEEADVPKRDSRAPEDGSAPAMKTVRVQRPHVDPSLCIGCGACEKVCPVKDQPAVYVTSVGETRSKTNVILLENTGYNQPS
ncbi:MAG: 4Fe-4S binding protein [Polyangiaceae bacterium]|nr:4Fe-4S binding protein [Polyangiaceae bacterium]